MTVFLNTIIHVFTPKAINHIKNVLQTPNHMNNSDTLSTSVEKVIEHDAKEIEAIHF